MSSIGTGVSDYPSKVSHFDYLITIFILFKYDLSAAQFSPDGRIFQVEYANKAVEASG